MQPPTPLQWRKLLSRLIVRVLPALTLALPTAALAAERTDDAVNLDSPTLTSSLSRLARSEDELRRSTRPPGPRPPLHPVAGPADYGSAEAAFGNARGRPHEGQDIFAQTGTPVVAPRRAEVLETGSDGGRGNWAALYSRSRDETYVYFHMQAPAKVEAGERLKPGDRVGAVGCTGSCWGEHLHFELRAGRGPDGQPHDPLPLLEGAHRVRG